MLEPKIQSHEVLVQQTRDYLDGKVTQIPRIGKGKFDFQTYKAGLMVQTCYEKIDEVIKEMAQKLDENDTPITCNDKCSACCYQPVTSWLPEMLLIGEHLKDKPEITKAFQERYKPWRRKINKEDYQRSMNRSIRGSPNLVNQAIDSFSAERLPCPFLEDDSCSIYEVRPIICRQLLSLDEPIKCEGEDLIRYARISKLDDLIHNKITPLMSSLMHEFDIKVCLMGLTAITTFEYLNNGKAYIDIQAKEDPMTFLNF